jgi:hypothetical protein
MNDNASFRRLDAEKIVATLELLSKRIDERFPVSGLGRVCKQLLAIGHQAQARSAWIAKPIISLQIVAWVLIAIIVAGLGGTIMRLDMPSKGFEFTQFVQVLEAGLNDVVLIGAAIFFLFTLETRIKRNRALQALHELRAIAHIIDMHQLTKDPERLLSPGKETVSSPQRSLSSFELRRYLDYCAEMLSLTGKVAALYVQNFDDAVALASVNEIETLTTGLSRKIWQKLMIIHLKTP